MLCSGRRGGPGRLCGQFFFVPPSCGQVQRGGCLATPARRPEARRSVERIRCTEVGLVGRRWRNLIPGELGLFIPERLFFFSWPDPPCTRNAVAGRTMEAGAVL